MATLFLVRHGKSEWNALGKWTGHTDVHIIEEGRAEARKAGAILRDREIHKAHLSELVRTHETFEELASELAHAVQEVKKHAALNERHYGVYTGKNKWEVKEMVGDDTFQSIRRGWETPIPEGETLRQVYDRVVPYFETVLLPELGAGYNVLVVSHGNTLRALVKHLDQLDEGQVSSLEIGTGEVYAYAFDGQELVEKSILATNEFTGKV